MSTLHIGEFDSEKYWRNEKNALLPLLVDKEVANIISSMDELLFAFCEDGDVLLTRNVIDNEFKFYLKELGFDFENNSSEIQRVSNNSIFDDMISLTNKRLFSDLINPCESGDLYSVLSSSEAMFNSYSINKSKLPAFFDVVKVNSKAYSNAINIEMGIDQCGEYVDNLDKLIEIGSKMLDNGNFLIKDCYGVSGKGNILISNYKMLLKIAKHLQKQVDDGLNIEFIIEPFLNKTVDFSCQSYLTSSGRYEILSIPIMQNKGLAFGSMLSATSDFVEELKKKKYFEYVDIVMNNLHLSGYFGNVCIDSMIVDEDKIHPIVEINARKSMGLINYTLSKRITPSNYTYKLSFLNFKIPININFLDILKELKKKNILLSKSNNKGFLPLSSNCFEINKKKGLFMSEYYRGRLYYYLSVNDAKEFEIMEKQLLETIYDLEIKIM